MTSCIPEIFTYICLIIAPNPIQNPEGSTVAAGVGHAEAATASVAQTSGAKEGSGNHAIGSEGGSGHEGPGIGDAS